ncbi:MAG: hypothetical protein ACPGYI_05680, partial [Flavobacteriaceae bacterium]
MALTSQKAYLIAGSRTTVAPIGGIFRNTPIQDMAAAVLEENLRQLHISKSEVDDIFVSNAIGGGGNIARLCALKAGFSSHLLGTSIEIVKTLNKKISSGDIEKRSPRVFAMEKEL